MPCYHPQSAYRTSSGGVTFCRSASLSGEKFTLPCGQCIGCRLERSRQWAMRLMHEKKLHSATAFLTLTYDDEHLPPGGTLVKRDFQLFMKRLRKSHPNPVRFYACGEYGETTLRPHYHVILFNCRFSDIRLHSKNSRDENLYTSPKCQSLWPQGHHLIGEVTFESAAYVARYCVKKINGVLAEQHYGQRQPEFSLMSRRPGIASNYYAKYGQELRDHDNAIVNSRPQALTRFYDTRSKTHCETAFEKTRRSRKARAVANLQDNTVDRRRVKEHIAERRLQMSDKFRSA
jgi:hypothetical protein